MEMEGYGVGVAQVHHGYVIMLRNPFVLKTAQSSCEPGVEQEPEYIGIDTLGHRLHPSKMARQLRREVDEGQSKWKRKS